MGILQITTDVAGQIGVFPRRVKIITTDNLSKVTTAGYLNPVSLEGYTIYNTDIIDMWYGAVGSGSAITSPGTYEVFTSSISNGVITLTQWANPGDVLLPVVSGDVAIFNGTSGQIKDSGVSLSNSSGTKIPVVATPTILNHIAVYTDTAGSLGEDASTAINGGNIQAGLSGTAGTLGSFPAAATSGELLVAAVTNSSGNFNTTISNAASVAQAQVISIPDGGSATSNFIISNSAGTQTIATGNLALTAGNLTAGSSGHAGTVSSFPGTAAKGSLILAGVANTGNTNTTISNAAMGQASVISIPDPGAANANFLLNTGTANLLTDFQITQGVANGMTPNTSVGTWTLTRNAGGNYSYVHTAAANSPIVAWQFCPNIRTTSGKGLTLTSIDVLTTVGTLALTSATPALSLVNYIAGSAVTVTSVPVTGTLTTATGTFNVDNLAITTPGVDNTVNSLYILEITYVCQATTALALYGITLHYSQTIA